MLSHLVSIRSFLLAIFMIMAGSGFLSTLLSVRLELAGAGAITIGLLATSYFAGLAVGSLRVARLIASVGHIRSFAAFVSVFSASSLAYALHEQFAFWIVLRFVDGFVISGVFICLESWLNERAEQSTRSSILAGYMVALYAGQAAGQLLLNLGKDQPALPFMLSAILLSLALIPIVLTKVRQPVFEEVRPLSVRQLYRMSPLGMIGTLTTGVMLGAFYALGAVFAQRMGMSLAQVALFMSCVIAGGIALQWPLGALSDRLDRRKVIVATFFAATLISLAIASLVDQSWQLMLLGALFGGASFALYPLCVAHSNDHLSGDDRVGASGTLVLAYSAGAIAGPFLGALGMAALGTGGLFAVIGIAALSTTLFGFWRTLRRAPVPGEEQGSYQNIPRTSPMTALLEQEPD